MKRASDAMTAVLSNITIVVLAGVVVNGFPYAFEADAWFHQVDANK